MELNQQGVIEINKVYDELRATQEDNESIKKLYAKMVSEFRELAKEHDDLSLRLYQKASYFEDKLRAL